MPARSSARSSSSASSTTCRGRISTSPASPGRRRTRRPCPRARPRGACACSTGWCATGTRAEGGGLKAGMTEYSFYQLLRTPLEAALPRILEKVRELDLRAVVVVGSETRIESLSQALWTYDPASFLAHGSAKDGHAGDQPIWLTDRDENPNGAAVVVLA